MKICPDCKTHLYLCWAWEQDGTTDCGSCGSNFEENELIDVQSNTKHITKKGTGEYETTRSNFNH